MKKKISRVIIILLLIMLATPLPTKAMTLQEYKNKVAELKKQKYQNDQLTAEAEREIDNKRKSIIQANNTIADNEETVEQSKNIVAESEEKIKIREEELKDVLVTLQYTGTDNRELYTDYIFSSSSISEMMERQAIVEQVIEYTQEELDSLNDLIDEKTKLQDKLTQDNINLNNSISEYEQRLKELEKLIDKYASIGLDYESQLQAQEGMIKIYQAAGCKDNDDIDECYYAGSSAVFFRPLTKGRVTQAWNATHGGIDLGGNTAGTNVYAPANGTVVFVKNQYKCGGNIIYIHSLVDGKKYTLEFAHLRAINVKIGQTVKQGQVIATVGGDSSTWYYDKCTTGTHLHYAISNGYYFSNATWNEFSVFKANTQPTGKQSISNIKSTAGWTWSTRY